MEESLLATRPLDQNLGNLIALSHVDSPQNLEITSEDDDFVCLATYSRPMI
jgi:hypothetical protein